MQCLSVHSQYWVIFLWEFFQLCWVLVGRVHSSDNLPSPWPMSISHLCHREETHLTKQYQFICFNLLPECTGGTAPGLCIWEHCSPCRNGNQGWTCSRWTTPSQTCSRGVCRSHQSLYLHTGSRRSCTAQCSRTHPVKDAHSNEHARWQVYLETFCIDAWERWQLKMKHLNTSVCHA